jgi:tRNA uridine 5-carboxymethylaminomethyl modification enzyme
MMTSRSEYRLLLRHDNADRRLTRTGCEIGLVDDSRLTALLEKERLIETEKARLERTAIPPTDGLNSLLAGIGEPPVTTGAKLGELLKRPGMTYGLLAEFDKTRPILPGDVCGQVEIEIKYAGYIRRQQVMLDGINRLERRRIPHGLDFNEIRGLSNEATQKLTRLRPLSLGQAGRIPGVSPADITVLMLFLEANSNDGRGNRIGDAPKAGEIS